jgi:ELWxxDGT repeat protein
MIASRSRKRAVVVATLATAIVVAAGSAAAAPGDVTVTLVKEINPGGGGAGIQSITDLDGVALFNAVDGVNPGSIPPQHGDELYRSDGTAAGTFMVKDINAADAANSMPRNLTTVNGTAFFTADDGSNGVELWKSDGTPGGTVIVENINTNSGQGSDPRELVNAAGTLYFTAEDGSGALEHGRELWKSVPPYDATSTAMVEDIRTGNGSSEPDTLTAVGNQVYFNADDGSHGSEPWKSGGTPETTDMIKDIAEDPGEESDPTQFTQVGSLVYFGAGTNEEPEEEGENYELWKTDGTELNTTMVKDINTSAAGASSDPDNLTAFNGKLVFAADDGPEGSGSTRNTEPWISDGTPGGTTQLANLNPGNDSSFPGEFVELGGALYFDATDGAAAHGGELFRTDGTGPGTTLVADIRPGPMSSGAVGLTRIGDLLFFRADDGTTGQEPWTTNGGPLGPGGTVRVADISPGPGSSQPQTFHSVGGRLFFSAADNGIANFELWKATVEPAPPPSVGGGGAAIVPASPALPKKKTCKKKKKKKNRAVAAKKKCKKKRK